MVVNKHIKSGGFELTVEPDDLEWMVALHNRFDSIYYMSCPKNGKYVWKTKKGAERAMEIIKNGLVSSLS